ncbi:MAG: hypothetical protein M4579_000046 [Chaenotheca gracillima]|nr:MAG: hypothetical protein M4579_000046 [Chaenotheca gracillima]
MSTDRLLAGLLRSLQVARSSQEIDRQISAAGSLLVSLSNPLNVTLLTSQLLSAPSIWDRPDGLRTCLRVLSMFYSAGLTILRQDESESPAQRSYLGSEAWIKAVVNGADEKSPRWRHLLPIGGLVHGFVGDERNGVSGGLRVDLEGALATAANLALAESGHKNSLDNHCVVLVLNHTFELLSEPCRTTINYNALLPALLNSAFFSSEGFASGYFLRALDDDVVQSGNDKFTWPSKSPSFFQMQKLSSKPLMSSMGPLSRLMAHAVEHVTSPSDVLSAVDGLVQFSQSLAIHWRQNKLSEIDISEEPLFLDDDALRRTLPVLWQVLKTAMFASTIVLRAVLGRTLHDRGLATDAVAPVLAAKSLHILRHFYFISSRLGSNAFSTYTFVFLTAIDILSRYPAQGGAFLSDIRPSKLGQIPDHPLDRCLDLYFLNTGEHFTNVLSAKHNEELLLASAMPYLTSGGDSRLLEIFEAAHSVVLSLLSAPQNAQLAARTLPFYVDALLQTFPQNLSSRQFRLAFKTLIRLSSPPSVLSGSMPDLSSTLLEILRYRAQHAPKTPIPPRKPRNTSSQDQSDQPPESESFSQQTIFTLTLLDSFPFLSLPSLEEWLPLAAEQIHWIEDRKMREACKERFWEVLSRGEMDVERAEVCVAWWGTRGGRELVLFGGREFDGDDEKGPFMSGALNDKSQL